MTQPLPPPLSSEEISALVASGACRCPSCRTIRFLSMTAWLPEGPDRPWAFVVYCRRCGLHKCAPEGQQPRRDLVAALSDWNDVALP